MPETAQTQGRPAGDGWWEVPLRVRFSEVDSYGVVWHGRYLAWFEEARNDLARAYGFTPSALSEDGYQLPVRDLSMTFRAPARLEDDVLVAVRHRPDERAVLEFDYRVVETIGGQLLVTGWTRQVVTRLDGELLLSHPALIRRALELLRRDLETAGGCDVSP